MPITVACQCGKQLRVKDELAGKRIRCPSCGAALTVSVESPRGQESSTKRKTPVDDNASLRPKKIRSTPVKQRSQRRRQIGENDDEWGAAEEARPRRRKRKRPAGPKHFVVFLSAVVGIGCVTALSVFVVKQLDLSSSSEVVQNEPPIADGFSTTYETMEKFQFRVPGQFWLLDRNGAATDEESVEMKAWGTTGERPQSSNVLWVAVHQLSANSGNPGEDLLSRHIAGMLETSRFELTGDIERFQANGLFMSLVRFKFQDSGALYSGFCAMSTGLKQSLIISGWSPDTDERAILSQMLAVTSSVSHPDAASADLPQPRDKSGLPPPGPPLHADMLSFDVNSRGSRLITAHSNRRLVLTEMPSMNVLKEFGIHDGRITSVLFGPTEDEAIATTDLGSLVRWDLTSFQQVSSKKLHTGAIRHAVMYGGDNLVTCGDDHAIRITSLKTEGPARVLPEHAARVNCLDVSGNGRFVLSGGDDSKVRLYNVFASRLMHEVEIPAQRVTSVALMESRGLFAASYGSTVLVWRISDKQLVTTVAYPLEIVDIELTWSGPFLVIGGSDGKPKLWNLETGTTVHEFPQMKEAVLDMKMANRGKMLFSTDITGGLNGNTIPEQFK